MLMFTLIALIKGKEERYCYPLYSSASGGKGIKFPRRVGQRDNPCYALF